MKPEIMSIYKIYCVLKRKEILILIYINIIYIMLSNSKKCKNLKIIYILINIILLTVLLILINVKTFR